MEPGVIDTAGLTAFVETLRDRALFERGTTVAVARAPGRLDVMGGIDNRLVERGQLVASAGKEPDDRGVSVRDRVR